MRAVTNADIARIPGWFHQPDIQLFRLLLEESRSDGGDLAELGVYLGRSAVLLGDYLGENETLTVVDTFGAAVSDSANQAENDEQYATLTRADFESNYRDLLGDVPHVIQGPSSRVVEHATAGTHRLVHIDASHLYEHVIGDIAAARTLLMSQGVVVLDDYVRPRRPGVAAAAWQAVAEGLHPFALTDSKMYATWGDPTRWMDVVRGWVVNTPGYAMEEVVLGEDRAVRVWVESSGLSKFVPPVLMPTASRLYARVRRSGRE